MKTIHLNTTIGEDGLLKIETPTDYRNIDAEVILVLQPTGEGKQDAKGYPSDYFERLDEIEADDLLERPPQGDFETREPLE